MRSTQLRAFHAVAREGGVSAAAERLGLTQPAVTVQVRRLEEDHGVDLLRREGRGVVLTESGTALYEMTRDLFAMEERIGDFLSASGDVEVGHLQLAADGPHRVLPLVAAFRRSYPGIRLSVALGNRETAWRDLLEQRADVAVLANPPAEKRIHAQGIATSPLVAIVPGDHAWARRRRLSVAMLSGAAVVQREAASNTRRTLERLLKRHRVRVETVLELDSREAVVEAVAAGLGVGFLFAGEAGPDPRYKTLTIDGVAADNRDTLVCLKARRDNAVISAFLGVASASL